jgi:hypothetical protein
VKENGIDDRMDVDGVKNAPATKVPSLKKQSSFQSALGVLQQMVNEYDNQGYTPLLLACEKYKDYRKEYRYNVSVVMHVVLQDGQQV